MTDKSSPTILRRKQVEDVVGLKRSALYALIGAGKFPKPIHLSARAVGWLSHEVDNWLQSRIDESRKRLNHE